MVRDIVCRRTLRACAVLSLLAVSAVQTPGQGIFHRHQSADECPTPTSMKELAKLIDELDKGLYRYGKIVVKGPDVWGQNRLTQHRAEYEDQMKGQVDKFQLLLNSYQRRSDVAALSSATAIGASGTAGVAPPKPSGLTNLATPAGQLIGSSSPLLSPADLTSLALANAGASPGIGLEPTIALDERSRFLYHLQQLRRINIGDDRSDLPGYGLYLVRVPVSLLPGDESIKGKGASVTFRAKHQLTPDLLANTFRNVLSLDTAYNLQEYVTRAQYPVLTPTSSRQQAGVVSQLTQGPPKLTAMIPIGAGLGNAVQGNGSQVEIEDLYGRQNLELIAEAVHADQSAWYRHDPSIISWLLSEISEAYDYLREEARKGNPLFQPDQFERLGELAISRNFGQLRTERQAWFASLSLSRGTAPNPALSPGAETESALDVLAYALLIQSVYIDRQLKADMHTYAQRKGCTCGDPYQYLFHALWPTPDAQAAFNSYVACKWPIHVFSLDPMVDEQNQLDLFSQRSELQLALATAIATGQVSFENATSYARRIEQDLAAIGLNRTAVGFGAGDTTFGWQFYPRVQTPPIPSNPRRITNLLLTGGEDRNYDLRNRMIEPGPREAYALMVVPNFIPQIRLTSATNWFDLKTHHNDQLLETTDVVRLSRKLQVAKNALAGLCDTGKYRPEETELLADRLQQLESMLPTQGHEVILPFEADLTGSELFSSNTAALAPRLLTWYGEAGAPGTPSSIFILGTNFQVHNMKAIVGGVTLSDIDMMSRNVIRIDIPDGAQPVKTNSKLPEDPTKDRYVLDVHVATPNGISNHLFVEVPEPSSGGGGGPKTVKTTVTTTSGMATDGTTKTTTTIETTPPGIALPPGTILPMGVSTLPNGTLVLPGAVNGWVQPYGLAPGTTAMVSPSNAASSSQISPLGMPWGSQQYSEYQVPANASPKSLPGPGIGADSPPSSPQASPEMISPAIPPSGDSGNGLSPLRTRSGQPQRREPLPDSSVPAPPPIDPPGTGQGLPPLPHNSSANERKQKGGFLGRFRPKEAQTTTLEVSTPPASKARPGFLDRLSAR